MDKEVKSYKRYSLVNSESLRVSHVCRFWRTVAINTPRLWVKIRLSLAESVEKLDKLWAIIATRANNCPLNVEIIETPENSNRELRQRKCLLSSWISAPVHIEELRLSTFVGHVEPFPQALFDLSNFSSLTIHYRPGGKFARPIVIIVKTLMSFLLSRPSCIRLSLAGVTLRTSEVNAFPLKVLRLNLHHLSVQNCTVAQSDTLSTLIQRCHKLESCVFRNNIHQDLGPPLPTTFPTTLRLVEMDGEVNLGLLFSERQTVVYPHLATCNIEFNYPYKDFLLANPTILTLTIPPNTDITEIAAISPQIQRLEVHRARNALILCKAIRSNDPCLFPHLRELHIHLRAFVFFNSLKVLMQPVEGFTQPQADSSSPLEKLILTWSPRACASQGIRLEQELKPWYRWLEERGYWDRAVVRRSEEEWRFSWSKTRLAVSL
jgi:hypothetical protein